ncbi:hypothetical protein Poli38472_008974 [Pythium oligandrum]|uniref:Palmitoyltransferase n=1 Tax=Pythium oligandrum TaxID=41045 RepID=A0A8K1CJV8_PYTOL|nr:hypothetical protein Poli38472_008974 [Pythium oligandrum]|eukprot:TMW64807.1 hypothetical protein Poli38472_008974 [Pythium oligandrum]
MDCCCCECEAPDQVRYVAPTVVLGIIAYLYTSFSYYAQPQLLIRHVPWVQIGLFHAMTVLLCASLTQCLLSNESFVKRKKKGNLELDKPDEFDAVETKADGRKRFCRRCNVWKVDRMHHCSSCRRCVLKMDHHCVYINKCIGYYNYKFFLQFLGWAAATCLYMAYLISKSLLVDHLDRAVNIFFYSKLRFWTPSIQIVLVFFFGACLGLALTAFYALHLYLAAQNNTTLEYCEKRREPEYVNFFDVGVVHNLQQVFGTYQEWPYWFIPVQTPSAMRRGAISFEVNEKFIKIE